MTLKLECCNSKYLNVSYTFWSAYPFSKLWKKCVEYTRATKYQFYNQKAYSCSILICHDLNPIEFCSYSAVFQYDFGNLHHYGTL